MIYLLVFILGLGVGALWMQYYMRKMFKEGYYETGHRLFGQKKNMYNQDPIKSDHTRFEKTKKVLTRIAIAQSREIGETGLQQMLDEIESI